MVEGQRFKCLNGSFPYTFLIYSPTSYKWFSKYSVTDDDVHNIETCLLN